MRFFKAKDRTSLGTARDGDVPPALSATGSGVGRRGLVVGVGVAGAAAVTAAALHRGGASDATLAAAGPTSASQDGYRLTDHIKRYYETTRS